MELKGENMTSYKERQSTKEIPETPNLFASTESMTQILTEL